MTPIARRTRPKTPATPSAKCGQRTTPRETTLKSLAIYQNASTNRTSQKSRTTIRSEAYGREDKTNLFVAPAQRKI